VGDTSKLQKDKKKSTGLSKKVWSSYTDTEALTVG
jgi:hypothetical protein